MYRPTGLYRPQIRPIDIGNNLTSFAAPLFTAANGVVYVQNSDKFIF